MNERFILRLGVAAIVFGVFGLLLASNLPDGLLVVGGFAVAASAILLGLNMRKEE